MPLSSGSACATWQRFRPATSSPQDLKTDLIASCLVVVGLFSLSRCLLWPGLINWDSFSLALISFHTSTVELWSPEAWAFAAHTTTGIRSRPGIYVSIVQMHGWMMEKQPLHPQRFLLLGHCSKMFSLIFWVARLSFLPRRRSYRLRNSLISLFDTLTASRNAATEARK